MKRILTLGFWRTIALIVLVIGATGSLHFMFEAGRQQKSILLIVLFTGWVLSPFISLFVANLKSRRWSMNIGIALCFLALFLSIGSVVSYSGAFNPAGTKPAFMFLVVPFVSWLLIAIVVPIVQRISRKDK